MALRGWQWFTGLVPLLVFLAGAASLPLADNPAPRRTRLDLETASVDGFTWVSIRWAEVRGNRITVLYGIEIDQDGLFDRRHWHGVWIRFGDVTVSFQFLDSRKWEMEPEEKVEFHLSPDFMAGGTEENVVVLGADIPPGAKYLFIRCGQLTTVPFALPENTAGRWRWE